MKIQLSFSKQMKKVTVLFLIVIGILFFYLQENNKKEYFQKIDKKLQLLEKESSPSFGHYDKPIETLNLIDRTDIPLFSETDDYYPKIYGFKNKFLLQLQSNVVVLDKKRVVDDLVANNILSRIDVVSDDKKAYIFIDKVLYTYDGKEFIKYPYNIDNGFLHLYIDLNKLYLEKDNSMLILDRDLKNYTFYKETVNFGKLKEQHLLL